MIDDGLVDADAAVKRGFHASAHGEIRFGNPQASQENALAFATSIDLEFLAFDAIIANRPPVSSL